MLSSSLSREIGNLLFRRPVDYSEFGEALKRGEITEEQFRITRRYEKESEKYSSIVSAVEGIKRRAKNPLKIIHDNSEIELAVSSRAITSEQGERLSDYSEFLGTSEAFGLLSDFWGEAVPALDIHATSESVLRDKARAAPVFLDKPAQDISVLEKYVSSGYLLPDQYSALKDFKGDVISATAHQIAFSQLRSCSIGSPNNPYSLPENVLDNPDISENLGKYGFPTERQAESARKAFYGHEAMEALDWLRDVYDTGRDFSGPGYLKDFLAKGQIGDAKRFHRDHSVLSALSYLGSLDYESFRRPENSEVLKMHAEAGLLTEKQAGL